MLDRNTMRIPKAVPSIVPNSMMPSIPAVPSKEGTMQRSLSVVPGSIVSTDRVNPVPGLPLGLLHKTHVHAGAVQLTAHTDIEGLQPTGTACPDAYAL